MPRRDHPPAAVILCRTAEEAQAALELVRKWVAENGLTLHPMKTKIVAAETEGFDFLGYHFRGDRHWPREKSLKKFKDTLRQKTKRTSGQSLKFIIADVNVSLTVKNETFRLAGDYPANRRSDVAGSRKLRGWFAYFQHSHRYTFAPLDRWVRQRLRAILRKRTKRRGCAKGWDFHRWRNAFVAAQGLFNLTDAHRAACQSSRR